MIWAKRKKQLQTVQKLEKKLAKAVRERQLLATERQLLATAMIEQLKSAVRERELLIEELKSDVKLYEQRILEIQQPVAALPHCHDTPHCHDIASSPLKFRAKRKKHLKPERQLLATAMIEELNSAVNKRELLIEELESAVKLYEQRIVEIQQPVAALPHCHHTPHCHDTASSQAVPTTATATL
jgi:SMC interacting uncharacterized protein involved in chromosome segregation